MIAFVCGLHRSGTSLLARAIADHPDASGFANTGFPEDEGQFLQSVYPIAHTYGGPGRFGFDARAHLTEESPLATDVTRVKLFSEWGRHWDIEKPVLVEKSPPNLLKVRFLQEVFPDAAFVAIVRHPIAVSLATGKWRRRTPISALFQHWLICHELFAVDAKRVRRLIAIRYEDLVSDPALVARVREALGLTATGAPAVAEPGHNERYFQLWRAEPEEDGSAANRPGPRGLDPDEGRHRLAARFERRARRFGYSLIEPERDDIQPAPDVARLFNAWRDSPAPQ